MRYRKVSNIREFVWGIVDTDIAIKKDITRGVLNIRAVANYIINKYKIRVSIDSVISALRRYNAGPVKKTEAGDIYSLLKSAEIRTITKMASISLKKNEDVTLKLGRILPKINYEAGEVLRILEGAKLFKILFDKKSFGKMNELFNKNDIIAFNKNVSMVEMIYPKELEKTPGVFSIISNEFAEHDISIIDALICSNEHIIIVDEEAILKAFEVVNNLCTGD